MYFTEDPTCMHTALAALILPNNRSSVRSTFKTLTIKTRTTVLFGWVNGIHPHFHQPTTQKCNKLPQALG